MKKYLTKTFTFEAAHSLAKTNDPKNNIIHGHSFHVEIMLKGKVNKNGMILDLTELNKLVVKLKEKLDHAYLNEIYSMGLPTLENIGYYIWKFIIKKNYNLHRLQISRKTCNESFIIEL